MQWSEFPPYRSVCEVYQTVKNVPGAPISSLVGSKGPRGSLPLERGAFLPLTSEYSFRIRAKITVVVVNTHTHTHTHTRAITNHSSARRSKFCQRVKVRRHIRNAIDRRFVAAVARDMRFYIARSFIRPRITHTDIRVYSLSESEADARA